MAVSSAIRDELIVRARNKKTRAVEFTVQAPCEWRPGQVLQPESGLPFTEVGAWNFIADILESGCDVKELILEKPCGKIAYVIRTTGYPGCPDIYIKLTFSAGKVHGRSFHNSEY